MAAAAAARSITNAAKSFLPQLDRVLVQRFEPQLKTKGGVLLPEKTMGKVLEATVVSTGPGKFLDSGKIQPVSVKAGDRVLLPEFGGTKIMLDDVEYYLFRDEDILGKFES
ncbi:hypothetical protein BOX15_Mlig015605g1 [Macrostomum lignano]|uniref:10 kDa heat shock protein, mitochondrial n=1 Tax=Macrostomum lignano TaxID=282301 RepID=A0A267GPG5_9PLAT|nr:hypothetical protein BOX15_Mlig017857g1 [Macrostomum lignano]PAA74983.1 hypothetical protein BOX15_Mlig009160g1 [Macrostomum lignano]PAA87182.1 hypothetical protein BOX15_Mlig015605g1 [Macrostomum lignano]